MKSCPLLIVHAQELWTPSGSMESGTGTIRRIHDGAIAIQGNRIAEVGTTADLLSRWQGGHVVDATARTVTPALVDPHTHLLFGGWRDTEFSSRMSGKPLAGAGIEEGIAATVQATRKATDQELETELERRLDRWLESGCTLVEIKSGYGLSVADEIRMLEIIGRVGSKHRIEVIATVLAAHALPPDYEKRPDAYLEEIAWPVAREAKARGLAEFVDIFVERGAFSAAQAENYLLRCKELGLKLRVHAEQLSRSGGALVASRVGAMSVDHLERAGKEEIAALSGGSVIAVLLPAGVLTLEGRGAHRPPARELLSAGVRIALGSDLNPGTSTQTSPSLSPCLGTRLLGLTPDEALLACTQEAAASLGREEEVGRLQTGYRADLCIWDVPSASHLSYQLDAHRPGIVLCGGEKIPGHG